MTDVRSVPLLYNPAFLSVFVISFGSPLVLRLLLISTPPLHRLTASPLLRSTAPPPLSIDSLHRRPPLAHSAGVHTSASVLLLDQPHESSDLKPSVRASPRSEREPCRVRVASVSHRRLPALSCVQSIAGVGSEL